MINTDYKFWLIEYNIINNKRFIKKCEEKYLYDVLKLEEIVIIQEFIDNNFKYCKMDTYSYLSKYNYICMNVVNSDGILLDLDNFNINDFDPECVIVELYKQAINHRNYKLSKILKLY